MADNFLDRYRKDGKKMPTRRMTILFNNPMQIQRFKDLYGDAIVDPKDVILYVKGVFGVVFNCTSKQRSYLYRHLGLHYIGEAFNIYSMERDLSFSFRTPRELDDLVFLGMLGDKKAKKHSLYGKYLMP